MTVEFMDLEKSILDWFSQCRQNNINISGTILREKAEKFAKELGHQTFKASSGWLEKFKKRHGIMFRTICGESATVNDQVCNDWKEKLDKLTEGYSCDDIFNADETGMFYN